MSKVTVDQAFLDRLRKDVDPVSRYHFVNMTSAEVLALVEEVERLRAERHATLERLRDAVLLMHRVEIHQHIDWNPSLKDDFYRGLSILDVEANDGNQA